MSLHFLDWTSSTQSDHTEHSQSSLQMYPPAPPAPPPDEDDWLLGEEMAFTVRMTLFDWVVFDPSDAKKVMLWLPEYPAEGVSVAMPEEFTMDIAMFVTAL